MFVTARIIVSLDFISTGQYNIQDISYNYHFLHYYIVNSLVQLFLQKYKKIIYRSLYVLLSSEHSITYNCGLQSPPPPPSVWSRDWDLVICNKINKLGSLLCGAVKALQQLPACLMAELPFKCPLLTDTFV